MRFQVNLGLGFQAVPDKIENAKTIVLKMTGNAYFTAPNAVPHPTLASITTTTNTLETAYNNAQGGNKQATQVLKSAEIAYNNALMELMHYVEDRANADPNNGAAIISSAGMLQKTKTPATIPTFDAKNNVLSGSVDVRIKAVRGAVYVIETSPDLVPPANVYVWKQASIGTKATVTLNGFTPTKRIWLRYALILKNVPQDFSDAISLIVT
jgi:hypothetical protein